MKYSLSDELGDGRHMVDKVKRKRDFPIHFMYNSVAGCIGGGLRYRAFMETTRKGQLAPIGHENYAVLAIEML